MSERYKLNREDLKKIGKGALLAMGGALCTYLLTVVEAIQFEETMVFVAAIASILLNAGLKYIEDKK